MMKCRPILLPAIFSLLSPAVAAAQDSARFSVQGGVGTMLNVGANTQSVSFGFWPSERVGILVGAQRIHMPTEVEQFGDVTSVTRGGTTTFVSGELRWLPLTASRVSPYVLAYVELEEGPRVLTNVVECDPEAVRIGDAVAAVFHDTGEGSALLRFRPA